MKGNSFEELFKKGIKEPLQVDDKRTQEKREEEWKNKKEEGHKKFDSENVRQGEIDFK